MSRVPTQAVHTSLAHLHVRHCLPSALTTRPSMGRAVGPAEMGTPILS